MAYNLAVTAGIRDVLTRLGPLPQDASRRAFEFIDGIWWDSTKRVPDNLIVRHRNFVIGPKLYPWKLPDAGHFAALPAAQQHYDQYCRGDRKPLGLNVADRIGNVPFREMATLEIEPDEVLVKNGFPFPKKGATSITQEDFPSVIAAIERAADTELGAGANRPVARRDETSRYPKRLGFPLHGHSAAWKSKARTPAARDPGRRTSGAGRSRPC